MQEEMMVILLKKKFRAMLVLDGLYSPSATILLLVKGVTAYFVFNITRGVSVGDSGHSLFPKPYEQPRCQRTQLQADRESP
jgi:hypothetical protein